MKGFIHISFMFEHEFLKVRVLPHHFSLILHLEDIYSWFIGPAYLSKGSFDVFQLYFLLLTIIGPLIIQIFIHLINCIVSFIIGFDYVELWKLDIVLINRTTRRLSFDFVFLESILIHNFNQVLF